MRGSQHFNFGTATFERIVAHAGIGQIGFCRARGEQPCSGVTFVDFAVLPPGATIGVHTHAADNEELYVVVEGVGKMQLDDHEFAVHPGHVVINRPGGTHGLQNIGNQDLKLVVIEVRTP